MAACLHRRRATLATRARVSQLCKPGDDPYIVPAAGGSVVLGGSIFSEDAPIAETRGV
jgi:hypothetical protein